jgi:hypothetical protein
VEKWAELGTGGTELVVEVMRGEDTIRGWQEEFLMNEAVDKAGDEDKGGNVLN